MKTKIFNPKTEIFTSNLKKAVRLCFDEKRYEFLTFVDNNTTYEEAKKFFIGSKHNFDKEVICTGLYIVYETNFNMIEEILNFLSSGIDEFKYNCAYIKNKVIHCNNGNEVRYYDLRDLVGSKDQMNNLNNRILTFSELQHVASTKGCFFDEKTITLACEKKISWLCGGTFKINKKRQIIIHGSITNYKEYVDDIPFKKLAGDELDVILKKTPAKLIRKRFKFIKS